MATRTAGSPPSGLSLKRAKPTKVTRNRPSSTASAWVAEKGNRNLRFPFTVVCPSGVLRSSAASAMDLPESTGRRYHGGPRRRQFRKLRPRRQGHLPGLLRRIGNRNKKGGPEAALSAK